jgi:catecholate siderophore receptor
MKMGRVVMGQVVAPRSLRSGAAFIPLDEKSAGISGKKVSAVAS